MPKNHDSVKGEAQRQGIRRGLVIGKANTVIVMTLCTMQFQNLQNQNYNLERRQIMKIMGWGRESPELPSYIRVLLLLVIGTEGGTMKWWRIERKHSFTNEILLVRVD